MGHKETANLAQNRPNRVGAKLTKPVTEVQAVLTLVDSDKAIANTHGRGITLSADCSLDGVRIWLHTHIRLDARPSCETVVDIDQKGSYPIAQHLGDSGLMVGKHPSGHLLVGHRIVG